jgi:dTDP-4-dehydrorhamnose 3,5-epimerase
MLEVRLPAPLAAHTAAAPDQWDAIPLPPGVAVRRLVRHHDPRGYFGEVIRASQLEHLAPGFSLRQVSLSETAPGVRKAFHWHRLQSDLFCPVSGAFRIVLVDGRPDSATHAHGWSLRFDPAHPWLLRIPPGVAHGYVVEGDAPGLMLYLMDREYDPHDEGRIDADDATLAFPW